MFADDESSQASIQLTGDSQPHLSNGAAKQGHAQVSKKDLGSRGQTSRAQTSGKTSQTSRAQTSGKTSQSSRAQTSQSSRGKTSQTSRAQTSQSSRAQTSQSSRGKTSQTTHIQKVQVETYEDESETETLVGSEEEKGDGLYESQVSKPLNYQLIKITIQYQDSYYLPISRSVICTLDRKLNF